MPFGPGTYGDGGQGLAGPALQRQGIPEVVAPTMAPGDEALSEIIQMLRGGQAGSEKFIQLLGLLAGSTLPQMDGGGMPPQQGPSEEEMMMQAMGGGGGMGGPMPQGPMGPMGPEPGMMGPGGPSIEDLLG